MRDIDENYKYLLIEKLQDIKEMADKHLDEMRSSVVKNARKTIEYVQAKAKTDPKLSAVPKHKMKSLKLNPLLKDVDRLWNQVAEKQNSNEFSVSVRYPDRSRPIKNSVHEIKSQYTKDGSGEPSNQISYRTRRQNTIYPGNSALKKVSFVFLHKSTSFTATFHRSPFLDSFP